MPLIWIPLIGLFGGICSGLFGVGGGAIFVPLLIFLCGVNMHLAIGTSLAVVVPTALVAAIRHGIADMIDFRMALGLVLFSMIGAWLGAKLSLSLDVLLLKRMFAVLLVLFAVKLFFSAA